ncbi:hypothetical protein F53441_4666 [Fusarium austroafricanum]|uniref:Methyltransferase domain-containing protein n=1 Tax=Fusarium austroafricanum TaxID=2364996 RepID=A0A8H4NYJ7_9HYPO|nr:hypothetical protein F53441_4666 [Fusarium austroafricanum]
MAHRLVTVTFLFATVLLFVVSVRRTSEVPRFFSTSLKAQNHLNVLSIDPYLNSKLAHAEKIWKRSVDDRKTMVEQSGSSTKFPNDYIIPFNIFDFARPSFFCPHDLERIGSVGDGGKIVCGMTRYEKECPGPSSDSNPARELIVYSFGVNDDSSFEAELLQRTNARIWGYDSSVNSWGPQILEHQYSRAYFQKTMIGKVSDETNSPPKASIQDLMKRNGHSYVDIVKMDIEGAEFDTLTSLMESIVGEHGINANLTFPFGQLLVEIHFMNEPPPGVTIPKDLRSWMQWWSSLESLGLRPVSNEDNWPGDRNYCYPRFMEVRYSYQ